MRKMLLVAWREYSEAVKSKGFLVGIALAPLFAFGGVGVSMFMEGRVDTTTQKFAVIDRSGRLAELVQAKVTRRNATGVKDKSGKQVKPKYELALIPPSSDILRQRMDLSKQVEEGRYRALVDIGPEVLSEKPTAKNGTVGYYSERAVMDDARYWFQESVNGVVRDIRLKEAGIAPEALDKMTRPVDVEGLGLVRRDEKTGKIGGGEKRSEAEAFFTPFALMMLLYMMVMFGSMPQIHAVMEEKTQRIAEVLLGSIGPFQLMLGKLIGNLGIAVTTGLVYLGMGVAAASKIGAMDKLPMHLVPWFFAYLILAVAMYGALAVAVGSAVNDAKEAQSLTWPIIIPLILPMMVLLPIMKEPNGVFATVLSFIPPCTPLTMLLRQASPGGVPAWQPWLGLALLAACTVLYIWAAGRIFRIGLLSQGKLPKMGELLKWAIKG